MSDLINFVKDTEDLTPLLAHAWQFMPDGIRKTVTSVPVIPAVVAKAKAIAAQNPDFIRSDQGQVVGVFPEKEIYYGPTAGMEELRELVAQFWTMAYHLTGKLGLPEQGLDKRHVAIVSGATEGLAIVMRMFAYQQNVGIMRLYWGNYKNVILNAGGTPIIINIFDENYNFDPEIAEREINANNISSLLINFPANPSGDALTKDELISFAELARKLNITIIADEVYNYLQYKTEPQSMLALAPERTVVVTSASKEYLIPGARVGYVISTNKTFINSWMANLIRSSSSSTNVLGQRMLIDILKKEVNDLKNNQPPTYLTKIKEELVKRQKLIISVLKEKGFVLAGKDKDFPAGAISVLVKLPQDIKMDDRKFVEKAMELGKFSAIPGSVFGAPGCLRFGYAGMPQEDIKKLAQNIQDVLDFVRQHNS